MATRIINKRVVHQGWTKLVIATVETDGVGRYTREIEDHGNSATVLPYDSERRVAMLVRLPRAAALYSGGPDEMLEAPAGLIDPGESPEEAARREAREEAGLELGPLEAVAAVWPAAGVSSEQAFLYLAGYTAQARVGAGGGVAGENEAITAVEMPLAELWLMAQKGELRDLRTLTLTLALHQRRPALFGPAP